MSSEDYNRFTKAELIKEIENLQAQVEYLEERQEDFEDQLEKLKTENERHSRSIHDYEQKEREEEVYSQFPHMRPLWMRKGFDY
ncbi:hypothetical protein [Neobacillus sp. DY30]|uniref:hypothetical protein n=1 Tax=Neobacillus sp. DY30 TaxID=3047871 RepID=UPI0024BF567B|nr:hypothetical protein [Neobacillus sp. DY30]WHY01351.1 hypothetical protein QNH29_03610 [Neobacillus sp. DY30]